MAFPQDTFLNACRSEEKSAAMLCRPEVSVRSLPDHVSEPVRHMQSLSQVNNCRQMSTKSPAQPVRMLEKDEPDEQQEVPVGGAEVDRQAQPIAVSAVRHAFSVVRPRATSPPRR